MALEIRFYRGGGGGPGGRGSYPKITSEGGGGVYCYTGPPSPLYFVDILPQKVYSSQEWRVPRDIIVWPWEGRLPCVKGGIPGPSVAPAPKLNPMAGRHVWTWRETGGYMDRPTYGHGQTDPRTDTDRHTDIQTGALCSRPTLIPEVAFCRCHTQI